MRRARFCLPPLQWRRPIRSAQNPLGLVGEGSQTSNPRIAGSSPAGALFLAVQSLLLLAAVSKARPYVARGRISNFGKIVLRRLCCSVVAIRTRDGHAPIVHAGLPARGENEQRLRISEHLWQLHRAPLA